MIEVKNILFQPLTFHLEACEEDLHLGSRQKKQIPDEQVSKELRLAERRGMIRMTAIKRSPKQVSTPPTKEPAKDEMKKTTRKKGGK